MVQLLLPIARRRRRAVPLLLAALLLPACGDDGEPADAGPEDAAESLPDADPDDGDDGGEDAETFDDGDGGALPVRECSVTISYFPGGPVVDLFVPGEFNGWSATADRMTDPDGDGLYAVTVSPPPGEYGYKLLRDGEWLLDPANPFRKWSGGVENSDLIVEDCRDPELRPVDHEAVHDAGRGRLRVEAQYVDGAERAGLDPASVAVAVGGVPAASGIAIDAATGRIELRLDDLPPGKHTVAIDASDRSGRAARTLHVPLWIEEEPFEWTDGALYFVFTDRFRNGDPSNDLPAAGVELPANYQGGDFAGVIEKIEDGYFEALGVRSLWLGAVVDNPDGGFPGSDGHRYTGYHGYWPSDPRATQPRFGSLEELRALVDAAHRRGLRVIVDLVMNHVHEEHPYWRDHRTDGWFNGDGSCVCGREWCDWESHKLDCWFAEYLPDFDFTNHDATVRFVEDALWWIAAADLDGFRCDAVKHMPHVVGMRLAAMVARRFEHTGRRFYLVGETFTGEDGRWEIASFVGPDELDGQFDFPVFWAALDAFARRGRTLGDLDASVRANEGFYPADTLMSPFLGNHDVSRLFSHANGDILDLWGNGSRDQAWNAPPSAGTTREPYDRVALAFAFLLTQPGVPLIYYGDEIGMPGAGDPDNRRMMRFDADLSPFESGLLDRVRAAGHARAELEPLRRGRRLTLTAEADVYAYARTSGPGRSVLVVLNRGVAPATRTVYLPSELGLAEGTVLIDRLGGGRATASGGAVTVTIPPASGAIYAP